MPLMMIFIFDIYQTCQEHLEEADKVSHSKLHVKKLTISYLKSSDDSPQSEEKKTRKKYTET